MPRFSIVEAPSPLGLWPSGVEHAPEVLLRVGLARTLGARRGVRLEPPEYDPVRDPTIGILNPHAIAEYSLRLADAVGGVLDAGEFPVVLGGDCSILLGCVLALRRRGRYGLLFLDGHADFYQPQAEPNGEAASMDLALATGRGPVILTDLEGLRPLVRDEDVVLFGYRDAIAAACQGSHDVRASSILALDLDRVRRIGISAAAAETAQRLATKDTAGFWIHLDVDVLDDAEMPAVDYRMPDGLSLAELTDVLRAAIDSGRAVGVNLTIFNPNLDPNRAIARSLVACLARGLAGEMGVASAP
ncbi:MAG: arginase family protein [Dongiaceae bacterium]